MSSTFLRRPSETNSSVIVCHCTQCGTLVGASPSSVSLSVMEDLHECAAEAQPRPVTGETVSVQN